MIENFTPHELVIFGQDGKTILTKIPPSGQVARVTTRRTKVGELADADGHSVPIMRTEFGEVIGLPEPEEGTIYVVSILVLQALPTRQDLVGADTTPEGVVRDADGKILGVKAFQVL